MKHDEIARNLFLHGANCSQAVLGAFAKECGILETDAFRIASGFGGGFARMRSICGAVSGMCLVLNYIYASSNIMDKTVKDAQYKLVQDAVKQFTAQTGSFICKELLLSSGNSAESSSNSSERTSTYYSKRPCIEMVSLAVTIIESILEKKTPDKLEQV